MVTRGKIIAGALALLSGASIVSVTAVQSQIQKQNHEQRATTELEQIQNPVSTTKQISETESIPFETNYYNDSSLPKGQTRTDIPGQNGITTNTYEVTYRDNVEIGRKLISSKRTTEPTTAIIAIGTYAAPTTQSPNSNSPNNTYVNSAGNIVESPNNNPSNATAICRDGTYSHSQSRRGTCSHHGGVAQWL